MYWPKRTCNPLIRFSVQVQRFFLNPEGKPTSKDLLWACKLVCLKTIEEKEMAKIIIAASVATIALCQFVPQDKLAAIAYVYVGLIAGVLFSSLIGNDK